MICFQETAHSGFGDRLRGIAYLLQLTEKKGENKVLYNDDESGKNAAIRFRHFPARMTDLLRIEGIAFDYHSLPLPQSEHHFVQNSIHLDKRLIKPGFKHMARLRPRDQAVSQRVQDLGLDQSWLGLHIRSTDNNLSGEYNMGVKCRTLRRIKMLAWRYPARKVFIAADNHDELRYWSLVLFKNGYQVMSGTTVFDQNKLRQTSNFDMMVDFFGLATCGRIIRVLPSEFSRFASWVGGRRMRYQQLW